MSLENRLLNCANMNLPNGAQLIRLAGKRQAVNNFLMARAENANKHRKTFPFDSSADVAQVAAKVLSSANRVISRRLTDIKTLRTWEFADSETAEDSAFIGCFPSFGPFRTTPEFCQI
jgi:hypothetical protein